MRSAALGRRHNVSHHDTIADDAAGDLTSDGTHTYQYDAEGRLKSIDNGATATETYNALGWRVEAIFTGTNPRVDYLHDASGQLIGGYWSPLNGPPVGGNQFIFMGNRLVADYEYDGVHMMHANQLDSTTQSTDWSGGGVQETLYYPFGSSWISTTGAFVHSIFAGLGDGDPTPPQAQTLNRRYEYLLGRWLTPDPAGMAAADPANPQS